MIRYRFQYIPVRSEEEVLFRRLTTNERTILEFNNIQEDEIDRIRITTEGDIIRIGDDNEHTLPCGHSAPSIDTPCIVCILNYS